MFHLQTLKPVLFMYCIQVHVLPLLCKRPYSLGYLDRETSSWHEWPIMGTISIHVVCFCTELLLKKPEIA